MTTRSLDERKLEHKKTFNDKSSRTYNFKLYKAMRKYGFENFEFSLIERCKDKELGMREKYYIELYNTSVDGYNEALGGYGKPLWSEKAIEACKVLYENGWLLKDISDVFKSNPKTIGKKLREKYDIDTRQNSNKGFSKPIVGSTQDISVEFESISSAARYIINNNISKSKNFQTVISKIDCILKNKGKTAYGYEWNYK